MPSSAKRSRSVQVAISTFHTPPACDALVLGRRSPIGSVALRTALGLLHPEALLHVDVVDDVVGAVLARNGAIRLFGRETLVRLVIESVKPRMTEFDILCLDLDGDVRFEALP